MKSTVWDTINTAIEFVGQYNGMGREACAKEAIAKSRKSGRYVSAYDLWEKKYQYAE